MIALSGALPDKGNVARMQQVKATVGKNHSFVFSAPFFNFFNKVLNAKKLGIVGLFTQRLVKLCNRHG